MKYKILIITVLLISIVVVLIFIVDSKNKNLELYVIKYGDSLYHSKHVYYEDTLNKPLPFAWMFYVIRYGKKIILVDTGFRKESLIEFYNIDYKNPLSLLKKLNIDPSQITDVIITHSHFDHIGNVDRFINAKIYIQKDELENFKKYSKNQEILDFFKNNKNLITFDEAYILYDLFKIEKIGSHTIGSSVVSFNHKNKNYILTGDECYLLDNCQGKMIGTYYDIKKNKKFIEKIKEIADKVILTFHDPLIFDKYQKIDDLIIRIF